MSQPSILLPTWLTVALMALGMLGAAFTSYNSGQNKIATRVTALEAHQTDRDAKVDHIQEQVDRLVQWALGDKK